MGPTVVPIALQHSGLTEVITSFPILSEYTEHTACPTILLQREGLMGDHLDQPNRH